MPFHRDDPFVIKPVGVMDWDYGSTQALTMVEAGHRPGYYNFYASLVNRVAASGGNANAPFFSWNEPLQGARTLIFGAVNPAVTGVVFTLVRTMASDGSAPLTFSITPASITGSPRGNLIVLAEYLGPLP